MRLPLALARIAWIALIAVQAAWFGWLAPDPSLGRAGATALAIVPMLLPLWWIWRLRVNGLVVGGMLLLVYFAVAVSEAWVEPSARPVALIEISLIAVYFLALLDVRGTRGTRGE
ncbi:MAG: DUF2069 domain-containing protein [Candidatus Wenzhouxiangella sp. M2_3B_020]